MRRCLLCLVFLPMLLVCGPAISADGVLEINQVCATQTGCFSGDAAGFPVTIDGSAGKSYRLTSDVNVSIATPNEDGIHVNTSQVSIDLNGFSLNGPTLGSGTGYAIRGGGPTGAFAGFLVVKNGSIRGWKSGGLFLVDAEGVRVENLTFDSNDFVSIFVGEDARVSNNRVSGAFSSTVGIIARDRSIVSNNVVREMGTLGISCGEGCKIEGNTSSDNGDNGISVGTGSSVLNNTVNDNEGDGISAIGSGNSVNGNTAIGNDGYGLLLSGSTGYRDNTIFVLPPASGTVSGGVNAGGNVCNSSTTCP